MNVLDRSALLSTVDGDEDLLRDLCALFLGSYPTFISQIRDAVTSNDGDALARAVHTLEGSGGHFLTDPARALLTDLQRIGRLQDLNTAPARLADLEAEINRLKPELSILAAGVIQSRDE